LNSGGIGRFVTCLFGTAGLAWLLARAGLKLMPVDLAKPCAEPKASFGVAEETMAYHRRTIRSYRVAPGSKFEAQRIGDLEACFPAREAFVVRIRQGTRLLESNLT
jgi:hypothetical protein